MLADRKTFFRGPHAIHIKNAGRSLPTPDLKLSNSYQNLPYK